MITSFADFHFIRPYWFLALVPVAIFIILFLRNKLARGNWSEVCDDALLPFILQDNAQQAKRRGSSIAMSVASLLAIIALAGPTWERLPTPTFRNDAAVVIALDLSRSMNASDIKPNRLSRARYKIADILQQRKDGLTALMVYAGDAFTVTPLTSDTATISNQLNALNTDIMPSQGSNTLAALNLAVELLKQGGQQQGSILLITDGINADSVAQAEAILGNYKLSILGIGTTEGAPIKLADGGFMKDNQGNIVVPRLAPSQLASLAHTGGGIYQTISSDDSDIRTLIANTIDTASSQETTEDAKHLVEQWIEQGPWLLLLLLPLAALYFRKGVLIIPVVVLMNYPQDSYAFEWQDLWQTPDQQAQQAFNHQQYEQAAAQFQSPEWQAAAQYKAEKYQQAAETLQPLEQHTADVYYNQATALAKAGQLEQALETYKKALQLNPEHEDALYNKKLVEQALQKQQQDQKQDQDNQQSDSSEQNKKENKDSKSSDKSDDQQAQQDKQSEDSASEQSNQDQQQQNNEADKAQQQAAETEQQDKAKQAESEQASKQQEDAEKESAQRQSEQNANDDSEQKQAQEQWLNRIPDDPAGLLKRKFKYQYSQRNQSSQQEQSW